MGTRPCASPCFGTPAMVWPLLVPGLVSTASAAVAGAGAYANAKINEIDSKIANMAKHTRDIENSVLASKHGGTVWSELLKPIASEVGPALRNAGRALCVLTLGALALGAAALFEVCAWCGGARLPSVAGCPHVGVGGVGVGAGSVEFLPGSLDVACVGVRGDPGGRRGWGARGSLGRRSSRGGELGVSSGLVNDSRVVGRNTVILLSLSPPPRARLTWCVLWFVCCARSCGGRARSCRRRSARPPRTFSRPVVTCVVFVMCRSTGVWRGRSHQRRSRRGRSHQCRSRRRRDLR